MKYFITLALLWLIIGNGFAAAEIPTVELTIKDHRFNPSELELPANQKVKLVVHNHDNTPEEFESYDLNREKIVTAGGKITLFVGPLTPGEYKFFGEFNPESAQGKIIVR
ncbi:MAG: cupredoxin domain-containing protein [Proteobacteria bacterium]|nr:MAG: cupredoxin domain-containing protein [Pseudomonadota bacterium]